MENQFKVSSFNKIKPRFLELSNPKTFMKEISFAMQLFKENSYLASATVESKLQCVMNLAQTGLTLNPVLKLAYLVPRRSGNVIKCHVEPSYQGLVKLVTDTGSARTIYAHPVYEGDEFDVSLGTETQIIHKPKFISTNIQLIYAVAILSDGTKQVEVMTLAQIDDIRDMSESYKSFKRGKAKSCIWEDHYSEMGKKTVIKRLVKFLPKTNMWDKLGTAIDLDNQDYGITDNQVDFIDSLIMTAAIPVDTMDDITNRLLTMTSDEGASTIKYLQENQKDPIECGDNYTQGDIKNKISQIIGPKEEE